MGTLNQRCTSAKTPPRCPRGNSAYSHTYSFKRNLRRHDETPFAVHTRELLMDKHNLNTLFAEAARTNAFIRWNPPFPLPRTARLIHKRMIQAWKGKIPDWIAIHWSQQPHVYLIEPVWEPIE